MQRTLIALLLCLTGVAVLTRFQTRLVDPLEMTVHLSDTDASLDYQLHETVEGADFHASLRQKKKTVVGSGHITPQELQAFKAGLELQHAWTLKSPGDAKELGSLSLRQGRRSHQVKLGLKNLALTMWLFDRKNLLTTTVERTVGRAP